MRIPYALTAAVEVPRRREQMAQALARGLEKLDQVPIRDNGSLSIACYGPSLRDTWQDLRHPIISMSGATRFLAERGIIPDYHIEMDPRPHKVQLITPPVPGVTYLIASVCHPNYFDALKDEKVLLWHTVSSSEAEDLAWLYEHAPNDLLVSSGSNVGLAAIQVGGLLGFRHFEIHGMDGSHSDGVRHAGPHSGKTQKDDQVWTVNHHPYRTSKIMANGAAETINALRLYPIFCVFHGTGLVQALVREEQIPTACCADEALKARFIRSATAQFVDLGRPVSRDDIKHWSAWDAMGCGSFKPEWLAELQVAREQNEARRTAAAFNTGTISLEAMLQLRAVCEWKKPQVAVEVGTFIGNSTAALSAPVIYTCDKDNDCVPATDRVRTFPRQRAGQMCEQLVQDHVRADLVFLDGRLTDDEVPLLKLVANDGAVFVVDDFHPGGKGEANVKKLAPLLENYGFVAPYPAFAGRSTLAMLVPLEDEARCA